MRRCGRGAELETGSLPETAPRIETAALIVGSHFDTRTGAFSIRWNMHHLLRKKLNGLP